MSEYTILIALRCPLSFSKTPAFIFPDGNYGGPPLILFFLFLSFWISGHAFRFRFAYHLSDHPAREGMDKVGKGIEYLILISFFFFFFLLAGNLSLGMRRC